MTEVFVPLGRTGLADRGAVGGKAATLGTLIAAGYRVPPGFVVTGAAIAELADGLDETVTAAAQALGPGPFAVRSSAVDEDLPGASFAGLYETYLDVEAEGVADAVRRCFASAGGERVRSYNDARTGGSVKPHSGAGPGLDGMAVLVQQMVPAEAAGVAFTANPLTGQRDQVLVTAVRGLGEPLVSGEATGEEWLIRGPEPVRTRPAGEVLSDAQAMEVAELARGIESWFGVPQDIEWAIGHDGHLYLLQARPMTALATSVEWAPPGPGLWTRNFRLGEWLPEAMTPLFADWLVHRIEAGYLDGMRATANVTVPFRYAAVHGWYYNATPIPSVRLLARVLRDSRGRAIWFLYNALVRVSRDPAGADRAVLSGLAEQWRDELLPAYRSLVAAAGQEVREATPQRLVEIVDDVCRTAGEYLWSLAVVGGSAWKMEGVLAAFWRQHLAGPLAGTSAGEAGPQLLLRGLAGAEPAFPTHAVYSLDWYHPTAGETVSHLSAAAPPPPGPGLAVTRVATEQACRAILHDQPKLLARFDRLLDVTQRYAVIREQQARDLTLGWPLLRTCARRLGETLATAGAIATAEDFFFLTPPELSDALAGRTIPDLTATASARQERWQHQCRLVAPLILGQPPRLLGDPISRAVERARSTRDLPENAIIGQPASTGRATGPVRIVDGPADFAGFIDGEVLVAKATAPAWTPLFTRAVAVVTDGGTLAAHASLVAREYGIPAVVGTGDATSRLHTGQLVTVDGSAGTVELHTQAPPTPAV
jgi:rifampicin phosphotransferase